MQITIKINCYPAHYHGIMKMVSNIDPDTCDGLELPDRKIINLFFYDGSPVVSRGVMEVKDDERDGSIV